jgi:hypothetical protein
MRLRLFAGRWGARKRAAAEGAPSALAEQGVRAPVSAGSHRRVRRSRPPGREWPGREWPGRDDGPGRAASSGRPALSRQGPPDGSPTPPPGPAVPGAAAARPAAPGLAGVASPGPREPGESAVTGPGGAEHRRWGGLGRAAVRTAAPAARVPARRSAPQTRAQPRAQAAATAAPRLAWYEIAEGNRTAAGWRDCGSLETVLHREWADTEAPPAEAVTAIDRLADLPRLIKDRLAAGLDAIHVGGGGVPDLDDMGRLSGVPLPSGRATWDACAGAYGERKIVVGSRPSPTPDVMCHEVGHALDDIDGPAGQWQSDSDEFCALYDQCSTYLVSNLHRQRGILGRREFFADAFAAIASRQRPALVDMLGGDTRTALNVMLYFNMRYGI